MSERKWHISYKAAYIEQNKRSFFLNKNHPHEGTSCPVYLF